MEETRVDWPSPGDPDVEVLHPQFTTGAALLFLIPWAFPIFILSFCALAPGFYLGEAIAGDSVVATMILLGFAGGVAILLCWLVLAIRRRVYRATTVLASPTGVQARDHRGSELRLRWEDVASISALQGVSAPTLLARVAHTVTYELASVGQPLHPSAGLIGWGTRELAPNLPAREASVWVAQRRDRATGAYEIAIPFNLAGPVTPHNRLVVHAGRYRPDLFARPS